MLAGQIGKPHGLGGEVYVVRISDDPRRFDPGSRLLHEDGRELVVAAGRSHRDRFLVSFEGYGDREAAETLRGALYVPAGEARALEAGEFWEHDLEGLEVVLAQTGEVVGTVSHVLPGAAQDLLAVATEAGERLVPLVAEIVTDVDVGARRVSIDPPEGLL